MMKSVLLFSLALLGVVACNQRSSTGSATGLSAQSLSTDSAAIADAVHGFYRWYTTFSKDTTHQVDFTDDSGEHLRLIPDKLERYYAYFKASGFVSQEFIAGEYAFYKQCSQLWQKELIDEVPSCMDADKYFCAQDWDPTFWTTSPVRVRYTGDGRATATLYGKAFDRPKERNVMLKKENGKWLLTGIECDMGLETANTGIQLKPLTLDEKYVMAKLAARPAVSSAEFKRLELGNIISEDERNATGARVCLLDTILNIDRGQVVILGYDNGNETKAWLVQYGNSPKILFWEPVYYADQVEYMKTINTTISGTQVTIQTITDPDGKATTSLRTYGLTNQLIFERQ